MRQVRFRQVDVFTTRPFMGNPVAVVLDADGLDAAAMARIARWTNLSETTFVLPSSVADYRLRIFTPEVELPFAGHPTIGSAHAVIEAGVATPRAGALTQECAAGLVPLTVAADGAITARVPRAQVTGDEVDRAALSVALGAVIDAAHAPRVVDVGPRWIVVALEAGDVVTRLRPDLDAVANVSRGADAVGVTAFAVQASGAERLRVRSFAPAIGAPEDPVCGSGNAAVAAYLVSTGLVAQTGRAYVASQGREVGRDGRVRVTIDAPGEVRIGGHAVTVVDGTLRAD